MQTVGAVCFYFIKVIIFNYESILRFTRRRNRRKFIETNLITYEGKEKENMRTLYINLSNAYKLLKENMCIKQKYEIMWGLRSIENEFNEGDGCIIITKEGKIHTKDFTQELNDKIMDLLSEIKFE
ncbi:MAG TPA: hypothetical protein VIJ75_00450 [Hanamia sp.]